MLICRAIIIFFQSKKKRKINTSLKYCLNVVKFTYTFQQVLNNKNQMYMYLFQNQNSESKICTHRKMGYMVHVLQIFIILHIVYISTYIVYIFLDIRIPTLHKFYDVVRHLFIMAFVVAVRIEITIKFISSDVNQGYSFF